MNSLPVAAHDVTVSNFAAHEYASRPWIALTLALGVGALSMIAPVLALGAISVIGVRALTRARALRFDARALMAPTLAALFVSSYAGLAGAVGVIFLWRIYADCRWSIDAAARLNNSAKPQTWRAQAHAWLTPLCGVCVVAYTAPHMVAGLPLDLPHLPFWVPVLAAALAVGAIFDWALRQAVDWRLGELARAPAAHMATHHLMFALAFGCTIDVSAGIVAMIAWRLTHAAMQPRPAT